MKCDLERYFGKLLKAIPTSKDASFIFSAQTLPVPPSHLITNNLYIARSWHEYDSYYRADLLYFFARKRTYRELALLILAVVFHPEPTRVHLELTHPVSAIKHLMIDYDYHKAGFGGYTTQPISHEYFPDKAENSLWSAYPPDLTDLPHFWLTNQEECMGVTDEEWRNRDTVVGFGTDRASVRLAQFLLDASRPQSRRNEYGLEGEASGAYAVGRWSAEVQVCFPGSLPWDPAQWPPPL